MHFHNNEAEFVSIEDDETILIDGTSAQEGEYEFEVILVDLERKFIRKVFVRVSNTASTGFLYEE